MSERKARVYTNTSRRASRQQSVDRRPVYKSVLGNPFHVDWPTISPTLQENILLQLITLLDGVAAYFQFARKARKRARLATNAESSDQKQAEIDGTEPRSQATSTPPIISHITVGINEVTKVLETEVRSCRQVVVTSDTTSDTTQPSTSVIFICHADLDTPAIVAHLPQLIALCNSARPHGNKIKVVPLPAGAQSSIADALGFTRRVSVMALDNSTPGLSQLEPLLMTVNDPPASWLTSTQGTAFEPSHIKQLLTSAPKDMKAAKERRMQGRAAAKERRRTRSQLAHTRLRCNRWTPEAGVRANPLSSSMFIAIIGTRFSGRTTIESYLIATKGFVPVRIIARALDYEARVKDYGEVSTNGQPQSFVDVDDGGFDATSDADSPDSRDLLAVSTAGRNHRPPANSFLSLDSAAPSPISTGFQRQAAPDRPLWFASAAELLEHVSLNWRSNFVTRDLQTERMIQMFITRPFFMLVSVDGPISDRFHRANNHQAGSLGAFVMANDADVYGRRHTSLHQSDANEKQEIQMENSSPLHSLQQYVSLHVINNFDDVAALHSYLDDINLLDVNRLRPNWDSYFMTLASLASMRSNCMKRRVGAILVRNKRILATGYNGTPLGLTNCNEGGCARCNNGSDERDSCLCLHAEENALLEAGRERVEGATLYCNTCPCLTCTVKIVQTGVKEVVYNLSYKVDDASAKIFLDAGVNLRRHRQTK